MFTLIVAHTHTDAPRSCNPPRSRRGFKCLFVHVFGSIGCTQDILLLSPPSPRPQRLLDAAGLLLQAHLSRRQVRAAPAAVYSHDGIVSHSAHTKSPQTEKKALFTRCYNQSHRSLSSCRTMPAIRRNLSFLRCFRAIRALAVSSGSWL